MLNLEECKRILNKGKDKFSKEEIKVIREKLYELAHIELNMREKNLVSYEK